MAIETVGDGGAPVPENVGASPAGTGPVAFPG